MKKQLILLPFLLCVSVCAPFGMPLDEEPDYIFVEHLQNAAADIRITFATTPCLPPHFTTEIEYLIERLKSIRLNQPQLQQIKQALRRYKVVADACVRNNYPTSLTAELTEIIELFKQREVLVRKIHALVEPTLFSHLVIHNLADALGHTPSPEEQAELSKEHSTFILRQNQEKMKIEAELFNIEQALLKDRRTYFEKYGSLILGASLPFGLLLLHAGYQKLFNQKKNDPVNTPPTPKPNTPPKPKPLGLPSI